MKKSPYREDSGLLEFGLTRFHCMVYFKLIISLQNIINYEKNIKVVRQGHSFK